MRAEIEILPEGHRATMSPRVRLAHRWLQTDGLACRLYDLVATPTASAMVRPVCVADELPHVFALQWIEAQVRVDIPGHRHSSKHRTSNLSAVRDGQSTTFHGLGRIVDAREHTPLTGKDSGRGTP